MSTLDHILTKFNVKPGAPLPIQVEACRVPVLVDLWHELGYGVGAEIGVDRGLFSAEICKHNPGVQLYGIDPWMDYEGYGELVGAQDHANNNYTLSKRRLTPYNVTLMRMFSVEAVGTFADNSLDFVYIDGNHAYDYVLQDITEWAKKVRPGGIVSGHDYCKPRNRERWQYQRVIEAVNDYVKANSIAPWFVFRGSGCSGWLWVK